MRTIEHPEITVAAGGSDGDSVTVRYLRLAGTVRFEAPLEGGRTYWHAIYDLEDAAVDVELYVRDEDGQSHYTPPLHVAL